MKNFKLIISLFVLSFFIGCTNEDDSVSLDAVNAPTNLSALMTIKQDNSGKVTIIPRGEGVTQYEIYYGDGTTEPGIVNPGASVIHTYAEGVYQVRIVGMAINGEKSEVTQELTVSFLPPTNLDVTISPVPGDNMSISVQATADLETYFQVYFGEDPNQIPVDFMQGETITHTYASVGTYTVRVVALSGGAATTDFQQNVTITNPVLLPVTFESSTLNYAFTNFGGANTSVVLNPDVSAGNGSTKVARLTKNNGAEVWAGSFIELGAPIDFSSLQKIKIKAWSPQSGIVVKMKLENLANPNINTEVDVTNTTANAWEELIFDFTGVNNANNYQRVVLFFNFGNNGTGLNYYFDDIELTSGAAVVDLPLTFESNTLTYTFTDFGGAVASVVNNPDATGINTSSKVGQLLKTNGSQVWAGSFIELGNPINFATMQKIKMKVWSPQAGIVVKLKLENLTNSSINTELDVTTTVANGWEELTYDFTGIVNSNNYQRVVVFFNFGNAGTGTTYYFDDIKLSN
ncbi:hypothetical protein [Flavobacterium proteolyticum]|uniref:PKD/Chitinase domain-containing protein n=1 Tax=Flavobacterium proteolyticum TaxID=2911683 RepID=A0ABR9WSC9_9FLAO|nr:hypothetical protein [Flavobacterium proteolyticum]MBE9576772.1 hypothetical protein [Flavobacterium proteolyticum]